MFDMAAFCKANLIRGYWDGSFTEAQVSIYAANYMVKGWFNQSDFDEVIEAIQPQDYSETE